MVALKTKSRQAESGSLKYKRFQIGDEGSYECDGHPIELRDHSLIEGSGILHSDLEKEIKDALREISPEITPGQTKSSSTELFWRPSVIKQTCEDLLQGSKNGTPIASKSEDKGSLMLLLATLNNCINAATDKTILFNGIRIIYNFDRTSRTPLKNANRNDDLPLAILHIGKPRDLSITPLRFNPAVEVTEVCDVCLGNYSTVILPPDSNKHLHCYFSLEPKATTKSDQQVLLIPFIEHMADHIVEINPLTAAQASDVTNLSQVDEAIPSKVTSGPTTLSPTEEMQPGAYNATPFKSPTAAESLVTPKSDTEDSKVKQVQTKKSQNEAAAGKFNSSQKPATITNKAPCE